ERGAGSGSHQERKQSLPHFHWSSLTSTITIATIAWRARALDRPADDGAVGLRERCCRIATARFATARLHNRWNIPHARFARCPRGAHRSLGALRDLWNIPPRSLRSLPPGGRISRSGRPFATDMELPPAL